MGHAALSHSTEGERAPERAGVFAAMVQLARQGSEAFVRYGIAQMTRGGIDEDTAQKMVERFPDMELGHGDAGGTRARPRRADRG